MMNLKTQQQAQRLMYSKSAASRILGNRVMPHQVTLEVWDKVALVKVKYQKPTFISKKTFEKEFVQSRRERAAEVTLHQQTATEWLANSADSQEYHHVSIDGKAIACSCHDYQNQKRIFGRACCKHSYKLIFELGFKSLKEFELA
jgi:hypothetical protein